MESISSTVLVQRGDKVVQGLSAEDLLDVISNLKVGSNGTTRLIRPLCSRATAMVPSPRSSRPRRASLSVAVRSTLPA